MKKIYFLIGIFATLMTLGFASCSDNDDVSNPHTLTDDEIAEMARQDSIAKAQREKINADLILNYDVPITISSNSYDGTRVAIDCDKIAELFGISKQDLLDALGGSDTPAVEVKGFAIEGTTHADNPSATNSGAAWGHWWDANGDVVAWGDKAMVFAEFDPEKGEFNVGQFPGHLKDGQQIKFIEALRYNDKRAAVVMNVTAHARGQVTATVVSTQTLTLNATPKSTYDVDMVPGFDIAKLKSDLGVSSMDDVSWVATKADGSYEQEYSAEAPGFWFDKDGNPCSYGDDARVFTAFSEDTLFIGQMPDKNEAGTSITLHYGAMKDSKIAMVDITVNFQAYQDPETAPAGNPESVTKDITLTKPYDNTYTNVQVDVKDILRNAFKMTTYQIFRAMKKGDLKVYMQAEADTVPSYTADAPGYWLDADGNAVKYAQGVVWLSLGGSETSLYIYGGNHADNCPPTGQTVKTKFIVVCNGVSATFNVTYDVTAQAASSKRRR